MQLWIYDSGASREEIERGVQHAVNIIESCGVTVEHVYENRNDGDMSEELWKAAERCAFEKTFEGWSEWPEAAILSEA